jgi:hypothetical protein
LYRLINQYSEATAHALDRIGDLQAYLGLRNALESDPGAAQDQAFRRSYRQYWRMNAARLPDHFYTNYFTTLAACRQNRHASIESIAEGISRVNSNDYGLQFSFATKLAHMVDARIPVYDSFVAAFFFYTPPPVGWLLAKRLSSLLTFHDFLTREYARVIELGLLKNAITHLRDARGLGPDIPDQRIIDWLIWAWVSLLRQGGLIRGDAFFD